MDFRENFRNSMARNPTSKFSTHWEAAITGVFGKDPQCNATIQFGINPYISSAVLNKYLPMNTHVYKVHLLSM